MSGVAADEHRPVEENLSVPKLFALGIQHVLVMYAGAVAVPLILGRALKLTPEEVAFLISADLFTCGLATLVQCVGFPGVGIRLPVMMGVTFASRCYRWPRRPRWACSASMDRSSPPAGRSFHGETAAAVPACGDRHNHIGDWHFADAGGD